MPDINGIPYVESSDLVSAYPAASQALAQEVSDQLASKLPYSYGTATPSTSIDGFLWYDENDTPPTPKFWDGAAFQALGGGGGGKILQVVRATDSTERSTTSSTYTDVTGMAVSITPSAASSAVIVIASFVSRTVRGGSTTDGKYQVTDSSNNPLSGTADYQMEISVTGGTAVNDIRPLVLLGYATPATTSSVTYKLRFSRADQPSTVYVNAGSTVGQMYALEIGA